MGEKLLSLILCYQSRSLSVATALRFFVWLWDTTEARQVSPGESQSDWSAQSPALQFFYLGFGLYFFCQTTLRPTQHRPWWSLTNESEYVGPKVSLAPRVGFNKETAWTLLATAPRVRTGRTNFCFPRESESLVECAGPSHSILGIRCSSFQREWMSQVLWRLPAYVGWQCVHHH